MTVCTQPVTSATRLRRGARVPVAPLRGLGALARRRGASSSIARSGAGRRRANGRASAAPPTPRARAAGTAVPPRARAQPPLRERPPVRLLDVHARVVDQVLVMDAGRARRHAREAAQAAVDVLHDGARRGPVVLEHVLDQIDAAARAVELVAEQHVSRARRRAEAAVHALAQDRLAGGDGGVLELAGGETSLHGCVLQPIRPGFKMPRGSKRFAHARGGRGNGRRLRLEHGRRRARRGRRLQQRRVARRQRAAHARCVDGVEAAKISPPPQSTR